MSGDGAQEAQATQEPEEWRRLSIRMLLVHPVMELIRFIPAILILVVVGTSRGEGGGWYALGGLVVGVLIGLLRWATTRYRVTEAQVEVRRGLFNRSVLTAPRDRIRSVDLTSHFMHRLLGLTRVAIGTGHSGGRRDNGLVLDGLSKQDGVRLRAELLGRARGIPYQRNQSPQGTDGKQGTDEKQETHETHETQVQDATVAVLDPAWLRYAPFTLSGLVTLGVVAAFSWRTINEAQIDPDRIGVVHDTVTQLDALPVGVAVLEVIAVLVVAVAVFSTVGYLLAFWNFRLTRSPHGTLHVTRGLVTTRSTTIEERRLRGAEYSEPLLLRLVGGARVNAITTGLRGGRGERGSATLLPPAPAGEARRVSTDVLRDPVPVAAGLDRHPRAALRRRITRVLIAWLVLIGAAYGLLWLFDRPLWTVWVAAVALPPLLLLGWERYRALGHTIVDGLVIFRSGALVRRRVMIRGDGVVGWTIRQSIFQRGSGLVTLVATTAAGRQRYPLADVDGGTALAIADRVLPDLLTPFLTTGMTAPPAAPAPDPRPPAPTR